MVAKLSRDRVKFKFSFEQPSCLLQVATRPAAETNWLANCCRSSRVVLDLCGSSNVGQTRWQEPRNFRQVFLRRKSSHAAVPWQTRENLKCIFCGHFCGSAFIGGWKFEMSFDQPSCMRCNEHNKQVDFILDWCSCHSGGVLCSERARRRKPQNVSGQSSVALSHRRNWAMHTAVQTRENLCSLCGLARCSVPVRFHIGVRLGRKPQWENFVCFRQCSMISDCAPGHASEVSKERFLEENDFSCSWPLSRQVRTTVSTKRPDIDAWDCMHGLQPPAFRARWSSNLPHHSRSLPSSTFPFFSPPFSLALRWSATNGTLTRLGCCRSSLGAQLAGPAAGTTHVHPATRAVA